jgi:cytochrome o ubiquinol oxidase subunit 1
LFIVAGIGALIICLGVGFQLLQLGYSIWKRNENRDLTGDPWDGRTLEWSVPSPAPVYNFAVDPVVTTRDAFWEAKRHKQPAVEDIDYQPIRLPKNTGAGVIIAGFAFVFGFAVVWHIWWLLPPAVLGIILTALIHANATETEYTITARQIRKDQLAFAASKEAA